MIRVLELAIREAFEYKNTVAASGYALSLNKVNIHHILILYMDDVKLYGMIQEDLHSLIQTVRIESSDIGMEYGIENCASIDKKRDKGSESYAINVQDDKVKGPEMKMTATSTMVFRSQI